MLRRVKRLGQSIDLEVTAFVDTAFRIVRPS